VQKKLILKFFNIRKKIQNVVPFKTEKNSEIFSRKLSYNFSIFDEVEKF